MLSIGGSTTRVYLAVGATDMRKGMDGLAGLVKSQLESDPTSGHLFVFCNAGRRQLPFNIPIRFRSYRVRVASIVRAATARDPCKREERDQDH
jgi:hypothetical protein